VPEREHPLMPAYWMWASHQMGQGSLGDETAQLDPG
jgi:hypothetical protein